MVLRVALLEIDHWHVPMYVEALRTLDARVVAVSDEDFPRARRCAETLGCHAYPDAAELLDREDVDLAFAFAPHNRMLRLLTTLVERNQPFAMEKPMALRGADLERLLPRIEASGIFAGVAFVRRLGGIGGALLRVRDELGDLIQFRHRFIGGPLKRYVDWGCPWMLDRERAGGGCMMNFGTHAFDLFLTLVAEPVASVFCRTTNRLHGTNVEDSATVFLQTASGVQATLESGYLLPAEPKEDLMSLATSTAYASNDRAANPRPTIRFRDGRTLTVLDDEPDYSDYVADVIRRFRAGEPPVADARDMTRALFVINAAYRSAETGVVVVPTELTS